MTEGVLIITMRYFLAVLIILIPFVAGSCEGAKTRHNDSNLGSTNNTDKSIENLKDDGAFLEDAPMPSPMSIMEPLTVDYYQDFLNSIVEFPRIYLNYGTGIDEEHLYEITQVLGINTYAVNLDEIFFANLTLDDIDIFEAYYGDNEWHSFKFDLNKTLLMPLFDLFLAQPDYFFNGNEYGGEENLLIGVGSDFGHRNFITLRIYLPDQIRSTTGTAKAFCKGWDPGDDPPVELIPILDYLENVILPEMRNHPYP